MLWIDRVINAIRVANRVNTDRLANDPAYRQRVVDAFRH